MFYFQQLLSQGMAGIDQMNILPTILSIAYTILLIGFLIGLYQAAMRGGDVQALGVTAIKYVVIAMVLANWNTLFREVYDSFNQAAHFVSDSSGAGDMFMSWMNQIKQQFETNGALSLLPLVTGNAASVITALMVVVSYLFYAIAVIVFGFFYTLYGCVLYVLGPLVLALLPMGGVGQMARTYASNLMIWNAWGMLYAIFGALITAVQANHVNNLLSFMGFFTGEMDATLLGLVSVFYAMALAMIPFIAHRIIAGDVGATAFSFMRAGSFVLGTAASGVGGFASIAGAMAGSGAAAAGAGQSLPVSTTAALSSSLPPPQPSMAATIRSGVMSAINGSAPPAPTGVPSSTSSATPSSTRESSGRGAGSGSSSGFRPQGLTQTLAFHAGRMAGDALRGGNGHNSKGTN